MRGVLLWIRRDLVEIVKRKVGMNRKEFSEYTGIPVRTLEDWKQRGDNRQNMFQDY